MAASKLSNNETFRCVACPGSSDIPSFLTFRDIINHSYNVHTVALERAVQASTLLPTTLTMFFCKLCPVELGSCFLTEKEIKLHIAVHSSFFANRWKEFSEQQCRVCDEVIDPDIFGFHMSTEHSSQLFADSREVDKIAESALKAKQEKKRAKKERQKFKKKQNRKSDQQVGCNVYQENVFLGVTAVAQLTPESRNLNLEGPFDYQSLSSISDASLSSISDAKQFNVDTLAEGDEKNHLPGKIESHRIRLKPISLLLDQSKKVCAEKKASQTWKSNIPLFDKIMVADDKLDLQPNQLALSGIKKTVSSDDIKRCFYENGFQVTDVSVWSGQGLVTFTLEKDANAWHGTVMAINNSSIQTRNLRLRDFEVKECGKIISVNDLLYFFFKQGFELVYIIFTSPRHGRIYFKKVEDAMFWEKRIISIPGSVGLVEIQLCRRTHKFNEAITEDNGPRDDIIEESIPSQDIETKSTRQVDNRMSDPVFRCGYASMRGCYRPRDENADRNCYRDDQETCESMSRYEGCSYRSRSRETSRHARSRSRSTRSWSRDRSRSRWSRSRNDSRENSRYRSRSTDSFEADLDSVLKKIKANKSGLDAI